MEKLRILIINTLGLHYEGITSVIFNYINAMDRNNLNISFIAFDDIDESLKTRFQELGAIYFVHKRKKNIKQYVKDMDRVLSNGFDVVHIHGNSGTMAIESVLAKKHKAKKIVVHCHNTTCNHKILNEFLKIPMSLCISKRVACSDAAGKWLYGKNKFTTLNNAIDINRYRYDQQKRDTFREEFGIKDEFVIGHSGHFSEQKNHYFLVDVFNAYHKIDNRVKLLLLSDGPRLGDIKEKVRQLGLSEHVIFAGRRSDASDIYNAMDLFLLPSLWEGLPLVMLEAQANGLPLLVSDTITQDAKCTQRTFYYSLDYSAVAWAKKLAEIRKMQFDRSDDMTADIRDKGFDIEYEANVLRKIYLE